MLRRFIPPSPLELMRQPVYHACAPLRKVPFSLQAQVLKQALTQLAGEAIRAGDFDSLKHRRVRISVVDAGLGWSFGLDATRTIKITPQMAADTEIRGKAQDFLAIVTQRVDPDTLFFQRRLVILGDVALGHEIKNLFDAQDLSRLPLRLRNTLERIATGLTQADALRRRIGEALRFEEPLLS